jgi:hypothetical protein
VFDVALLNLLLTLSVSSGVVCVDETNRIYGAGNSSFSLFHFIVLMFVAGYVLLLAIEMLPDFNL